MALPLFTLKTCGLKRKVLKVSLMGGGRASKLGVPAAMWWRRLKAPKIKLKGWNKEQFGRVETRKNQALKNMALWDTIGVERPLTQLEIDRITIELEEFKRWALFEEIMWRQKSREIWLKEYKYKIPPQKGKLP